VNDRERREVLEDLLQLRRPLAATIARLKLSDERRLSFYNWVGGGRRTPSALP
jgi:hypothetical protein